MESPWSSAAKIAGFALGAAILAPIAYYGAQIILEARCPECDADLKIVKRPRQWEPDLLPADDWD